MSRSEQAHAYDVLLGLRSGATDHMTLFAYDAKDAIMQSLILAYERNGSDCDARILHIGPPVDCWRADEKTRETAKHVLESIGRRRQAAV